MDMQDFSADLHVLGSEQAQNGVPPHSLRPHRVPPQEENREEKVESALRWAGRGVETET